MFRHISHTVRHSGFVEKHPVMTFILAVIGISTIGEVAISATGKTPVTKQPLPNAGGQS